MQYRQAYDLLKVNMPMVQQIISNTKQREEFLNHTETYMLKHQCLDDRFFLTVASCIWLIEDYFSKNYLDLPIESLIIIISTLIYLCTPYHRVKRYNKFLGYLQRTFILTITLELVNNDIIKYQNWRLQNNIIIVK